METVVQESLHPQNRFKSVATSDDARTEGPQWHNLSAEDVAGQLDGNLVAGLSETEARHRLALFGPNELRTIKSTPSTAVKLP